MRRTGSAVYFLLVLLLLVPFVTTFELLLLLLLLFRLINPLDANVPVDDDCRRESESKFLTRVVNESRFVRGNGDDVTYLLGDEGMLTTVVLP
jgi:hypothetical protein